MHKSPKTKAEMVGKELPLIVCNFRGGPLDGDRIAVWTYRYRIRRMIRQNAERTHSYRRTKTDLMVYEGEYTEKC